MTTVLSRALFALLLLAAGALPVRADFPERTVRFVVPYAAGGASDIVARIFASELNKRTGQAFVVENRPGANGLISLREMMTSPPDGYTLMVGNVATNAITPLVSVERLGFSYEKDVLPLARLAEVPAFVMVTANDFAPTTLAEFVALARERPGQFNYGSLGPGSIQHFATALLAKHTGIALNHISAGGETGQMVTDLVRGDTHIVSSINLAISAGALQSGQLRPLAVDTDVRLPDFPTVPTTHEVGLPNVGSTQWQGIIAPAKTPPAVAQRLHALLSAAAKSPDVQAALVKAGFRPSPATSLEETQAWMKAELARWQTNIREIDFKLEK